MTYLTPFRMFDPFRSLLPVSRDYLGEGRSDCAGYRTISNAFSRRLPKR